MAILFRKGKDDGEWRVGRERKGSLKFDV